MKTLVEKINESIVNEANAGPLKIKDFFYTGPLGYKIEYPMPELKKYVSLIKDPVIRSYVDSKYDIPIDVKKLDTICAGFSSRDAAGSIIFASSDGKEIFRLSAFSTYTYLSTPVLKKILVSVLNKIINNPENLKTIIDLHNNRPNEISLEELNNMLD